MVAPQTEFFLSQTPTIPVQHEISEVPFFPQEEYFCGPTTLAEVLNFYGTAIEAVEIAPSLFIPERKGSLQIEMVSSARQYGLLAYAGATTIEQLLSLVSEDIPVIVLQNLGTSWYPLWHYALVIGYNLNEETVLLHTGLSESRTVAMELFENTWRRGEYWMLATFPPERSSKYLDPFLYTRAAQDLMEVNKTDASLTALEAATAQWSDYWLPYLLLGNHFIAADPERALDWYERGADAGSQVPSYLNNYAYGLLRNGQKREALDTIQRALALESDNASLQDSLADIRKKVEESE